MYVTTSRKPSMRTRALARTLAAMLSATYENRGKKSVDDVAARAAKGGHSRFVIVSEEHGSPSRLSFAAVNGEWSWLEPEISFTLKQREIPKLRALGKGVAVKAEGLEHLFGIPEPKGEKDTALLRIENGKLICSYKDKVLELYLK